MSANEGNKQFGLCNDSLVIALISNERYLPHIKVENNLNQT